MKTFVVVLIAMGSLACQAQTTNNPPPRADSANRSIQTQASQQQVVQLPTVIFPRELKPNETVVKNHVYSGIIVQAAKTRNPLQLINPFAPARYGSGEDNLARDPINGQPHGLKLFGVQF